MPMQWEIYDPPTEQEIHLKINGTPEGESGVKAQQKAPQPAKKAAPPAEGECDDSHDSYSTAAHQAGVKTNPRVSAEQLRTGIVFHEILSPPLSRRRRI